MKVNPLTCIDFYKSGHRQQYPEGTELVVSNLTPRSGKYATVQNQKEIIFFGLQYFIKHFLMEVWTQEFFKKPKTEIVASYKRRMDNALGKDAIPVDHIEALHDLGYLPICIKALPEGSVVPIGIPCLTIHNTKKEFFWLTNYLETILSNYIWLGSTNATIAWNYRKLIERYSGLTGAPKEFTSFQCHDFSFRGMSSLQSACVSGAGHLLFFNGTDTVPAIDFLEQYYGANSDHELIGCSVPATEHSVMSLGGDGLNELATFDRLITKVYPKGIVSIVSDTWDFWKVIGEYSKALKSKILAREGKVVFRPDSGDPVKIICGDPDATCDTIENIGAVEALWNIFGGKMNDKGFRELDQHVGLIYGDSITYERAEAILDRLYKKGFSSANIVFGIGSYTYQYNTRDTFGWAVKATYGEVNGQPRNIFKQPKTDDGTKNSAKGLIIVREDKGRFVMSDQASWKDFMGKNALETIFYDGVHMRHTNLSDIKKIHKIS